MADALFSRDEAEAHRRFSRRPALLRLSVGFLAGLSAVLWDEAVGYMVVPWACTIGGQWTLHATHLFFLTLALIVTLLSWRDWRLCGGGGRDDEANVTGRSRFLAIVGMAAGVYSALTIIAMWIAVFFFNPCR